MLDCRRSRTRSCAARPRSSVRSLRERTGELEARVAALKEQKRSASDPVERDRIDAELAGADGRGGAEGALRQEVADVLDEILPEAFATVREGARRLVGTTITVTGRELTWDMVPYDVQLMGGIQLHFGKIARNGDRRRQDARRHAAALSQCAARQGRASRHGQLVPRPPRLAVDGAPLQLPRPHRRLSRRHRAGIAGAPRRVLRRHHLRHEQRVRLRLPARQHGGVARPARAAAARLRDRRRSRLGAHRRSAYAAHHLGPGRERERRRCTSSTTPPSRGSCAARSELVNSLVGDAERELEKKRHGRGRDRALQGAAGHARRTVA